VKDDDKTLRWHTTSDSASGKAHFWTKEKYSRRRSLCGRVTEAKLMQDANPSIGECARCKKALAAMPAKGAISTVQIIEKLQAGYALNNRGTGWWLSAPERTSGAADAVQVDADLMTQLEAEGALRIVMLTTSMRAELPK
jgi:hypothetical protein